MNRFSPELDDDDAAVVQFVAADLWSTFDAHEKTLVRFGMFPASKMPLNMGKDATRLLAVALMACAKRDGGMRA